MKKESSSAGKQVITEEISTKIKNAISQFKKRRHMELELQFQYKQNKEKNLRKLEKNAKMAFAIQQEENKLQEKRRMELEIKNAPDCGICFDKIFTVDILPLESCEHLYHKKCLGNYLRLEVSQINYIK